MRGMHGGGCAWQWQGVCVAEGHVWQRVCMAGGMHGGGVRGRGHAWKGAWKGGVHGRGHVWQEGMCGRGDMCGKGACMAGKTAIAAGGTHPTGMHSCLFFFQFYCIQGLWLPLTIIRTLHYSDSSLIIIFRKYLHS